MSLFTYVVQRKKVYHNRGFKFNIKMHKKDIKEKKTLTFKTVMMWPLATIYSFLV